MSTLGPLFRPFERLVTITIRGKQVEVPEGNMLLRGFQYLAPENVACQYCRVTYDLGEGTPSRVALSCKLMVQGGMRITEVAQEIKYCLRGLELGDGKK